MWLAWLNMLVVNLDRRPGSVRLLGPRTRKVRVADKVRRALRELIAPPAPEVESSENAAYAGELIDSETCSESKTHVRVDADQLVQNDVRGILPRLRLINHASPWYRSLLVSITSIRQASMVSVAPVSKHDALSMVIARVDYAFASAYPDHHGACGCAFSFQSHALLGGFVHVSLIV